MRRIIEPLQEFGVKFLTKRNTLPLIIQGSKFIRPINYLENRGSAQCKSAVMIAGLMAPGVTKLKCKPSRDHTELFFRNVLKIPLKIVKTKKFDYISVKGNCQFKSFKYNIPGDVSSASFFIVLTLLSKNSKIVITNINLNPTRTGMIKILNLMGAKIRFKNVKTYKGEKIGDIIVTSKNNLKGIKCPAKFNSSAIDEILLLFLVSSVSKGVSIYRDLGELNKKESKRYDWGIKILKMIGVKTKKMRNFGLKIYGNPNLNLTKNYTIKSYLKDHRIFMLSVIAALTLGGKWKISDSDSIDSSFPNFKEIIKNVGGKLN